MKKRVLSAALSLCMLLTLLPTAAFAAEGDTTDPGAPPAPAAPVAKIGETEYTTLEEAVTAASSATTSEEKVIDLEANVSLQSKVTITADVTINGHDKTITGKTDSTDVYFEITGGTLTISNATLMNFGNTSDTVVGAGVFKIPNTASGAKLVATGLTIKDFNRAAVDVRNGAFEIQNCKIDCDNKQTNLLTKGVVAGYDATGVVTGSIKHCEITGPNSTYDDWSANGIEVSCGATVAVEKTSITSLKGGISVARNYGHDEATVTVTDCTINATNYSLRIYESSTNLSNPSNPGETSASLTINGGNYTGKVFIDKKDGTTDGKSSIAIKAGTFSTNVTEFLKPGLAVKSEDGTFSVAPAAPEKVYAAKLADQSAEPIQTLYDENSYNVSATQATEAETGDYYTEVAVSVKNLKKHTNANSDEGHWVGFALAAPEGATQMKYDFGASKDALTLGTASKLEENVVTIGEENKSGIAFYVDAGSKTLKTWAQVQWLDKDGSVLRNTVYHMDLSGVTLAMDEDTMPTIRPAKLHDNAETNAYKDEDLYTAGSYKAAITSQGAGGVYNVAITAQQLREHTNNGTPKKTKGYWVGFDVAAPEGVTKFKCASGATIPENTEAEELEILPDNKTGVAFYFNAQNKATRTITVQWIAEGEEYAPVTFSVDLSGVAYYQAPSHGGSGSSGGSASTTYTLTFETNGGSAISKVTKNKGTTIDLAQYAPTKSGATFEGWYADKGLTKKITSVKLDANTTVYAKWTETPVSSLPFGDVKTADWFYNDVKYVYEKGMMAGTAADVFAPNATTTRAMIVTILYRLEGSPAVTGTSTFVDVPAGQWYTDAVNWAAANQIVKGTSATTFAPNDSITREQMAAILYRYAQYKGYDVTKKADLSGYSDNGQVSAYAKDALAWANAAKLINGVTNTTLAPQGNATRAQVSAILHRFCDGVVK